MIPGTHKISDKLQVGNFSRKRLLILGGTGDALTLIQGLQSTFSEINWDIILSVAGRTQRHPLGPWRTRTGGFGGVDGLTRYLATEAIDLLIDITHPFAQQMSHQAQRAADALSISRLMVARSPWQAVPGDRWITVPNHPAAAAALPALGQRIFLSIGRQELDHYLHLKNIWFLMRVVESPKPFMAHPPGLILVERGPFSIAVERALLHRHAIDAIVSKNSGGEATYGKLVAARELQLPVVMVQRPPLPPGPWVATVDEALRWIGQWLQTNL